MTFSKTAFAATAALALMTAPTFAQTTANPAVTAESGSTLLLRQQADTGVDSVGDAIQATGDFAADTVGGAVNLTGDVVTATGEFVAGTGQAISDLITGPTDLTTVATVYRVVPQADFDARIAAGVPITDQDNTTLIGQYVMTLDGTTIGRIDEVERTEAGALQTLSLDTAVADAELELAAEATTLTDDGIVLALTDAEFIAVVEAANAM